MEETELIAAELRSADKASLSEALGWIGSRVDDTYGTAVGRLEDVWIDPGTGAPRWLLVEEGRFGGRTTLIPFKDATAGAGHVWIPYERDVVREAPEVDPSAPLTQQVEAALLAHFDASLATALPRHERPPPSADPGAPPTQPPAPPQAQSRPPQESAPQAAYDPSAETPRAPQEPSPGAGASPRPTVEQQRYQAGAPEQQPAPLRPPAQPRWPVAPVQQRPPVHPQYYAQPQHQPQQPQAAYPPPGQYGQQQYQYGQQQYPPPGQYPPQQYQYAPQQHQPPGQYPAQQYPPQQYPPQQGRYASPQHPSLGQDPPPQAYAQPPQPQAYTSQPPQTPPPSYEQPPVEPPRRGSPYGGPSEYAAAAQRHASQAPPAPLRPRSRGPVAAPQPYVAATRGRTPRAVPEPPRPRVRAVPDPDAADAPGAESAPPRKVATVVRPFAPGNERPEQEAEAEPSPLEDPGTAAGGSEARAADSSLPTVTGLDGPYRVEIELTGDVTLSGELKSFRMLPADSGDERD